MPVAMDLENQKKWDRSARSYDFMTGLGPDKRWAPYKRKLFSHMQGRILFLALGTGLDIQFFPPDLEITAIDISPKMIEAATDRVAAYRGTLDVRQMDVHELDFDDAYFDQIYTSCTFCSVPRPIDGLKSLFRVMKPGGELRMFEHTGRAYFPFKQMFDLINPFSSRAGPNVNRPTVANVEAAGFRIREVSNVYLDVVKTIYAERPRGKVS
jgi:ubiquinone/menaquinone biosynthesis C-methylase UbiE